MIRRQLHTDTASQHRISGIFALAFGAAAITSLAGVLGFDILAMRIAPLLRAETIPGASWPANWLPTMMSAAAQQNAAVGQWMNIVLLFGAITALVACVNALIGFVSHANERRYETALRGLVGASPAQLQRTLRRDAWINAAAGSVAGMLVGGAVAIALARMWNPTSGAYGAWPLLATTLCFAVAAYASRVSGHRIRRTGWMGDALAPEARTLPGFGAEDLRALLTTAQLACAVALTIVSMMVWSYASTASAAASGAENDRYVARAHGEHQQVLAAVRAAGARAESIASPGALLGIGAVDQVLADCGACSRGNMYTPMFPVETQQHIAGAGFFRVAGIALRYGREFDEPDEPAREIVVNEMFASRAFQGQHAIGKRVLVGGFEKGAWYTVIGVVADVRVEGLHFRDPEPAEASSPVQPGYAPAIYFSAAERAPSEFDVIVQAPSASIALAGLPFEPLLRVIERARAPQQSFSRVLTLLGLLLCAAAVTGSFTATMLSVQSRRQEISIRRAVGARRADVVRLVYGRVAALTLRSLAAGAVMAVALTRAVEVFVPGLPAFDAALTLGVCSAFFATATLAALIPLRAALAIAPAQDHAS